MIRAGAALLMTTAVWCAVLHFAGMDVASFLIRMVSP